MPKTEKRVSQTVIIVMCWLIYSLAYLGRYSYNSNITLIIDDYGVSKAQAGLVATFFFFAYGTGQVVNGILSEKYNKKWLFPIALVLSSLINLSVFFGAPFFIIKYLWLLNGFVQSCLWSGIISVISKTVDDKHMNPAMLFLSTTTCVGTAASYLSSSFFSFLNNYRMAFVFGAAVMTALGIIWFIVYSPELEIYNIKEEKKEDTRNTKGLNGVITVLILLGFVAVVHNILKDGLTTWVPDILKKRYNTSDSLSILLTIVLPILGVFGGLISIRLSRYIKDFINLVLVFFAVGAAFVAALAVFTKMNVILAVSCFGIVVCMMHAINNVVTTIVPLNLRENANSGKIAGIMNGCAYVGSTISSYGLGKIADIGGWQTVLNLILALSLLIVAVCGIYSILTSKKRKVKG